MNIKELPLFPLKLILLPLEKLPLHIFEPRYKKMIYNAISNNKPFGIVWKNSDNIYNIGCQAKVSKVINEYPNGEYDIVVQGTNRFEIDNTLIDNKTVIGKINYISEDKECSNSLIKEIRENYLKILISLGEVSNLNDDLEKNFSYEFIQNMLLPIDIKKQLISTSNDIKEELKIFPINKIWGVGNKFYQKLHYKKINTAYELTQKSDKWIQTNMSITGLKMVKELRGERCHNVINKQKLKKSIMTSRTFGNEINDFIELAQAISTYANICAAKLRKQRGCAKTIYIMIFTNPFKNNNKLNYKAQKMISLSNHTDDSFKIVSSCIAALKSLYRRDCLYKKGGVILSDIIPKSQTQISLFTNNLDMVKRERLMLAMDQLNHNLGKEKIRFAVNGFKKEWGMKQANLSPCYTTRIKELLRIKY
tara:strand:- start:553 stop:1815 length:1263 start_codon:yes stop_codon:yes gene_type:complete